MMGRNNAFSKLSVVTDWWVQANNDSNYFAIYHPIAVQLWYPCWFSSKYFKEILQYI